MLTHRRAISELVLAAAIWGFGFIGQAWILTAMGPFFGNGFRFLFAFITGLAVIPAVPSLRKAWRSQKPVVALIPGLLLAITILLQTGGLRYTTVTKAGFITVLYVVFVPFLNWIFYRHLISRIHVICVSVALVGMALICQVNFAQWNRGDLMVLLCAISASFHIMSLHYLRDRIESGFLFNLWQTFWAGCLSLTTAPFVDDIYGSVWTAKFLIGLVTLSVASTLIAFAIQIRAQKVLSPMLVSLLFLLESPFAAFFGFLLMGEVMTLSQWSGATLILCSAALSIAWDLRKIPHLSSSIS